MADNALYPPYAQDGNALDPNATPFRYAGYPVGWSSTTAPSYLSAPSGDVSPIVAWYGGHPVTAAMRGNALDVANAALQFGPADVAAIRAFHGSPYSFEQFDPAKIGTGEGAQAYGHGLYFAENEGVARGYRDRLAPAGQPDVVKPDAEAVAKYQDQWDDLVKQHRAAMTDGWRPNDASNAVLSKLDALHQQMVDDTIARNPDILGGGSMYEVSLHADPEHFLDWDKPLSEQSQHVQDALADWNASQPRDQRLPISVYAKRQPGEPLSGTEPWGERIYQHMSAVSGNSPEKGAQTLQDAGIAGIKYLDAGSRAAGEGSRNYVVFSPDIIDIIRRYGIAGLIGGTAAAGAASNQQQ